MNKLNLKELKQALKMAIKELKEWTKFKKIVEKKIKEYKK